MKQFKIITNQGVFYVYALSVIHARQVAGKKLVPGEYIEDILPI